MRGFCYWMAAFVAVGTLAFGSAVSPGECEQSDPPGSN